MLIPWLSGLTSDGRPWLIVHCIFISHTTLTFCIYSSPRCCVIVLGFQQSMVRIIAAKYSNKQLFRHFIKYFFLNARQGEVTINKTLIYTALLSKNEGTNNIAYVRAIYKQCISSHKRRIHCINGLIVLVQQGLLWNNIMIYIAWFVQ